MKGHVLLSKDVPRAVQKKSKKYLYNGEEIINLLYLLILLLVD